MMGWMAPLRHLSAKLLSDRISSEREPSMGEVTTIGFDLAKHVFQVHGVDAEGATVLRKLVRSDVGAIGLDRRAQCSHGHSACPVRLTSGHSANAAFMSCRHSEQPRALSVAAAGYDGCERLGASAFAGRARGSAWSRSAASRGGRETVYRSPDGHRSGTQAQPGSCDASWARPFLGQSPMISAFVRLGTAKIPPI